jgi:hypothetical protein
MATKKRGILTSSPEWWRHLRPWVKRQFWKRERRAGRAHAKREAVAEPPRHLS